MTQNTYNNAAKRGGSPRNPAAASPAPKSLARREPGLATLVLGLAVMLITLILPQEHRPLAFYPALVCVGIGVIMTLRHGPDQPRSAPEQAGD